MSNSLSNFLSQNKVLLFGLLGAIGMAIQQYADNGPVNYKVVVFAVIVAVIGFLANNIHGQWATILGSLLPTAGILLTSAQNNQTIDWWHILAATAIAVGAVFAPAAKAVGAKAIILFVIISGIGLQSSAQSPLKLSNPFSPVKKDHRMKLALTDSSTVTNTLKVSVSLPGYWYSNGNQEGAVIGLGYTYEHYVNDSLIYSIGPYLWYKTPVPTGSTQLPIGYGAAATYRGIILFGILTPDFVHWGPVLSLNFSFGNGGISL